MTGLATAVAHSNIALAKYWGKSDVAQNLPAVPSLSITLAELHTTTTVNFDAELTSDEVFLDGKPETGRAQTRVTELLDRVRRMAGFERHARVTSSNNFPTAAGLASSASGFAALALAATHAAGLAATPPEVSALARRSSASAARSVYGGFVELGANAEFAEPVELDAPFPLELVVAVTSEAAKEIGSTEGMLHTAKTSPYYPAWLASAPALFETVKRGVRNHDFETLGRAMEQSTLMMHCSMMSSDPALIYFRPETLAVVDAVRKWRKEGLLAFFTADAGPHVKVLTRPSDAGALETALGGVPGVLRTIRCTLGPNAHLVESSGTSR